MRALSIRQPYAELILRGIKTVEYRSRPTSIVNEPFWIYASKTRARRPVWSKDLSAAQPPTWLTELAEQIGLLDPDAALPTGVIVGTASIERISQTTDGMYRWHLTDAQRLSAPRKPTRHPQPAWFRPF